MADGVIKDMAAFRRKKENKRGMEWRFLSECFDYGIMPTDLDGIVERNGKYLVFEEKGVNVNIMKGQHRMLDDLNRAYGMTIFIIWGDTEVPYIEEMEIWRPYGQGSRQKIRCDIDLLRLKTRQWFEWADK